MSSRASAKRKAESPEGESRPQRKRSRHSLSGRRQKSESPEETSVVSPVLKKHFLGLYNSVHEATNDESSPVSTTTNCRGRLIATDFLKLPPRKRYPDYYTTIKKPIALDTIYERLDREEYDDTEALKADLTLMTSNAKKYNVKGSSIYDDAVALQKIVKEYPTEPQQSIKVTLRRPQQEKSASVPQKQSLQQGQDELLNLIESVKEPRTKRVYSEIFMDAPSRKLYPEYYAFIQRVICLNDIRVPLLMCLLR
jgi:Bromodomain